MDATTETPTVMSQGASIAPEKETTEAVIPSTVRGSPPATGVTPIAEPYTQVERGLVVELISATEPMPAGQMAVAEPNSATVSTAIPPIASEAPIQPVIVLEPKLALDLTQQNSAAMKTMPISSEYFAWTTEEDSQLLGLKGQNKSWKEISVIMKSKRGIKERFKQLTKEKDDGRTIKVDGKSIQGKKEKSIQTDGGKTSQKSTLEPSLILSENGEPLDIHQVLLSSSLP